jgi:hypothetical protein
MPEFLQQEGIFEPPILLSQKILFANILSITVDKLTDFKGYKGKLH